MIHRGFQRIAAGRLPFILLFLAIVFNAATGGCQTEVTVSAAISPAQFPVDSGAVLTITVNGSKPADVRLPDVAGLQFQSRGTSTQVQIINGSFSAASSLSYLVQADKPGQYTIPPFKVSVDGTTLTTKPVAFEVTPAADASTNPMPGSGPPPTRLNAGKAGKMAFISVSESKGKGWVGEIIPVRIKAYFRQGIKVNLNALPVLKGDGIVMPQLDQHPQQTQETINGIPYSVLTWDTSISAVKEGSQALSVDLDATLLLPRQDNSFPPGFGDSDAFQDDFFKNFFGGFENRPVKMSSTPFTFEAKALPPDPPQDFSGAIGHFSLSVQARPAEVAVGDPLTLTMTVSGSGNFDLVKAPRFPEDPKWKIYPPSATFEQGDKPDQGKKTFEQAVVVKDDHVQELSPVSFSFFDPATGKYITLTSPAIPIAVRAGAQETVTPAQSAPAAPQAKAEEPQQGGIAGLAPIHLRLGGLQKTIVPVFARLWFIIMLGLCLILLLAVFCWRMRLRYLRNNPAVIRKKEMRELFENSMARIQEAAEREDGRYLAVCRRAIQEILGRCWQIEPTAITLADLEKRLQPSSGLIAVFAEAERGAYANYALSADRIREYSGIIYKELSELL